VVEAVRASAAPTTLHRASSALPPTGTESSAAVALAVAALAIGAFLVIVVARRPGHEGD
jgi:hypothetical protein